MATAGPAFGGWQRRVRAIGFALLTRLL